MKVFKFEIFNQIREVVADRLRYVLVEVREA